MTKENQIGADEIEWGVKSPTSPPRRPRIAQLTLVEFTGRNPRVISEDQFGPHEHSEIEAVQLGLEGLLLLYKDPDRSKCIPHPFVELHEVDRSDCKFIASGWSLMVLDADTEELLGGITRGTIFVDPAARGRGLARDMHISLQGYDRGILAPGYFSEGGYGARLAAHREAVLLDHQAGKDVHPENLVLYAGELAQRLGSTDLTECENEGFGYVI